MTGRRRSPPRSALSAGLVQLVLVAGAFSGAASSAEIRGSVSLQHAALFGARASSAQDVLVSVAVFPAEGQSVPSVPRSEQEMRVAGSGIQPLYVALPRGSRLRFNSGDAVHHELFTHSHTQPLTVRLGGHGLDGPAVVTLSEAGDLHWFCRIHAKSYARVDVVDTPLVRTLRAGEPFEFRNLAPGKWRLRVAAPGAETVSLVTEAVTAPPPLSIPLAIKGLMRDAQGTAPPAAAVERLFPNEPGL